VRGKENRDLSTDFSGELLADVAKSLGKGVGEQWMVGPVIEKKQGQRTFGSGKDSAAIQANAGA
jgi:hypothetical protein